MQQVEGAFLSEVEVRYSLKVQPKSSRSTVVKNPDGTLKVYLRSAPTNGKANEELLEVLSDEFGVSKSRVKILRGQKQRKKLVEIFV